MSRLLFVDDEQRVLDGLRQSLRSKRNDWEMAFASSGQAALQQLAASEFDVVISDMRMPGMDGAELLSRVSHLQPQAIRMVLSGQMDQVAAARAANVAHRFLAKPCDTDTLIGTVMRALDLKAKLSSDRMRACVGGLSTLPSLPKTCRSLNEALRDKATPLTAVAAIIREDSAIAAKVLQLVNSAFFGISRKITSLEQAVSYLGVNTLRNLVMANALFEQLAQDDMQLVEREQQRALLVARAARRLLTDARQAELAFTAGLLHNVGGLALLCRVPDEWAANVALARERGMELHDAELERLGVTHASIGAYLLGLWGVPHEVMDAVAAHHDPWESFQSLDANLAVRIASALGLAVAPLDVALVHPPPPAEVLARFGLEQLVSTLRQEMMTRDSNPGQAT